MRYLNYVALGVIIIGLFCGPAAAQKRKKPVTKKPVAGKTVVPPMDVRLAREKVDIQLANVNAFVDKYGPIAQSVEVLNGAAAAGRLKKSDIALNELTKKNLIIAIRDLKAGLVTLESEFRTKPVLAKYLPTIRGITDLAAQSEDTAIAGKFVAAKDPLRDVSKKLTDTLAAMPK